MGNQVEDAAIAFVTATEQAIGHEVLDTRRQPGAPTDLVRGERIVEVKAYGGAARGEDLWLEPAQVAAALAHLVGSGSMWWTTLPRGSQAVRAVALGRRAVGSDAGSPSRAALFHGPVPGRRV